MNIILAGGSGAPNYGDELILRNWLKFISEKTSFDHLHVEGTSLKGVESSVQKLIPSATYSTGLLKAAGDKTGLTFFEQLERGGRFIEHGVYRDNSHMHSYAETLTNSDIFHLHGGGYMNDMWPHFGFLFGVGVALKKKFNTKFVCSGLGVTPLTCSNSKDHKVLRHLLNHCDMLGVRDPFGLTELTANTEISPFQDVDDAFLCDVDILDLENSTPTLHICTYDWITENKPDFLKKIDGIASNFEQINIWECAPAFDQKAIKSIQDLGHPYQVTHVDEILNKGLPFSINDTLFTSRFHPALQISRIGGKVITEFSGKYYSHKHRGIEVLGTNVGDKSDSLLKRRNSLLTELKLVQAEWIYS